MYVSLETLRRALLLVDSLAELDDPAGFAGIVLPGLATLAGCDVLTYNEIGLAAGETRYADYPAGALDPATQPVFAAYVHEHPLVSHYRATGSGEPVMISDFLSRQRFHRLGLYAEFFRGIPVEHQIAISLPGPDEQVIGSSLGLQSPCEPSSQHMKGGPGLCYRTASARRQDDRACSLRLLRTKLP